ncbi:MAG: hypothetical protein ACYTBX_13515 [Planctomycetota bacterium]|jgi:hypothetical protein
MKKKHQKPGHKPDNLQIDGDWQDRIMCMLRSVCPFYERRVDVRGGLLDSVGWLKW